MQWWKAYLVAMVAIATAAACGGPSRVGSTGDAQSGVRAYILALRSDDPRQAYNMLSDQTRKEVSYEQFEVSWRAHKGERLDQANSLEEGLRGAPNIDEQARVRFGEGNTVGLIRERGQWKLKSGLVSRTVANQPRDAVRILAAALSSRDFDALMRVLTNRRRNGIARQLDGLSTSLLENLNDEIALIGPDRAELTWDTETMRYKVVLRKEGTEWRVDDLHIRPKTD